MVQSGSITTKTELHFKDSVDAFAFFVYDMTQEMSTVGNAQKSWIKIATLLHGA